MKIARTWQILACVPVLAGLCGCGLLGIGSTVGAVVGIMAATSEPETEYIYPPEPVIVLGTVAQAGIEGGRVTAFGQSTTSPLFAGTYRAGIYRWDTVGSTWVQAGTGFNANLSVSAITVDPNDPNRILAGTGPQYAGGVWLSADGGATWAASSAGLTSLNVRCIAAVPGAAPSAFLAGTDAGVFRSTDGGVNWAPTGSTTLYNGVISGLAVEGSGNIFASTLGGGVYLSTDSGATWAQTSAGLTDLKVTALAYHPSGPTLYAGTETAGVFRSVNSGTSWQSNTNQLPTLEVLCLAVAPSDPGRVWASTTGGLCTRGNWAGAWADPGTPPWDTRIVALLQDSSNADILHAGGFSGGAFYCSNATGAATFGARNTGLMATDVRAFAAEPVTAGWFYAGGGFDAAGQTSFGISVSPNSGASWTPSAFPPSGSDIRAFVPHPVTAGYIYAAVEGAGVWFSANSGGLWSQVWTPGNLDVLALEMVTPGPDTLLAGCLGGGAYRTADGGTSWTAVTGIAGTVSVHDFSFEPGSATNAWAATSAGVYASTDGGLNWTAAGQPTVPGAGGPVNVEPIRIQVDPDPTRNPVVVYVGTESNGVFLTSNGGTNWSASTQHIEASANVRVWDFCALAAAPYGVYVATSAGLYRTRSGGADWSPIHNGDATILDPAKRRITIGQTLALTPTDSSVLWVGTGGRGVITVTLQVP